jgi:type IV pilus assembly protein PilM
LRLPQKYGWIGVDVGTHTVKLAQMVREREEVRLHRAAVIQRPSSWSGNDGLALEKPIPSYGEIRAALECGDFIGRNAIGALPMNVCQLRGLNVPPGTHQERRTIIADELAEDWAGRTNPMEFDFWETDPARADKNPDAFNVNVVAAPRPWVSQLWRDCRQNGLNCWLIDGLPLAMARSVGLTGGLAGGKKALVIDWGYSNTTMCIASEERPHYSRRVHDCAFGGVLEAIVNVFDVTFDEAQYLAESEGLAAPEGDPAGDPGAAQAITRAVSRILDELIFQIGRTLQFTDMHRRHLQPSAVWLMGGGASLKNIAPFLSQAISLPVHIWNISQAAEPIACAAGNRAAVFGNAAALSALAWAAA